VALYGGRVVKFQLADVSSSNFTVGHRFMGKQRISVSSLSSLREKLRENGVLVDFSERELRIREGLAREAAASGGRLIPDEELLKTVANLNEYPSVIRGSFEERFLELPQEILVTVLREHQKYFSVVGADGQLLPVFLAAINLEPADAGKIREGHERVLRARLADAAFFWQTDRKTKLGDRLDSLRGVLFQERIGSYYEKTQRVLAMLPKLAALSGCEKDIADLETACKLSKCDLVTEMVKEFTDLQGIVGGLYARAEGYPETVWRSIYEQYFPKSTASRSPSTAATSMLALADRLDSVCGCFSIGLIPKGSGDPFAVRRQANGIVKILLDHRINTSFQSLIRSSLSSYGVESPGIEQELREFFMGRLRFFFEEAGYSYDCINAVFAVDPVSPLDARERVEALQTLRDEPDFLSVASSFKRVTNILAQTSEIPDALNPALLTEPAEIELWQVSLRVRPVVEEARAGHDYVTALRTLASMRKAVDGFFDEVLVMAEDPVMRGNRLALLRQLSGLFLGIADIAQIVLEKSA
jgi:glycyl-tRNA synthetase beta chain